MMHTCLLKKLGAGLLLAGLLVSPAQAETVTYLHTDLLGSVVLETDQNRNVVKRYEYEPYGLPRQAIADAPGYTGHAHDAGSGLVYMQQRYYDPGIGRFLSVDPVTADSATGTNFNRYWYGNNNPYKFTDPDGRYVESALDVALIAVDIGDISSNGLNWTNGISLAANVVGLALPGATGLGVGTRAVSAGVDAARGADKALDGAKGADFVVTPSGTAVPTSQSRMVEGLEAAGMKGAPLPGGKGTSHTLPDGNKVGAMEPSGQAPRRASFTNPNNGPVSPDGKVVQPPRGASAAERREYVRDRTHVEQRK